MSRRGETMAEEMKKEAEETVEETTKEEAEEVKEETAEEKAEETVDPKDEKIKDLESQIILLPLRIFLPSSLSGSTVNDLS